ncbi:GNAT family N-acetyltransferase [Kutzneria sp. CA-103260]|uniref:GNAT family N-acetyltransferase n=1 Tax=Kutzneria sp. CA-103260 TaxID=2802641 RepID=UPI001BED83DB|nr:GNAT family N-acetyltransferase [Kutzneria sp. CA-103260]QUQ62365.1 GNAT family N-acetyltransferase [Kutzneria sp. CA-103260]
MRVRTAQAAELSEVGELRVTAYNADHLLDAAPAYAAVLRELGAHGDVLVAVDDGKILGTVTLERWHADSELATGPAEAEIRALAVAPWAQGRGVGRVLVQAAIDRATEWQAERLLLLTQPSMRAAHHLYEQAGFARVPDLDVEPFPGLTLLAYRRSL